MFPSFAVQNEDAGTEQRFAGLVSHVADLEVNELRSQNGLNISRLSGHVI